MRNNGNMTGMKNKADPLAQLLEGQKLATQGKFKHALVWLKKGLSIAKVTRNKRAQSLIHSEMGLCHQEKGNQKKAFKEFTRAYHAWPNCSSSLLMVGTAYLDQGDLEKAGKYLTRALAVAEKEYRKGIYAKDPSNLLNTCLLLSKASRDLATKTVQLGLKKFPNHPLLKKELQAAAGG
ncbi:MAG: tetratricopeptide repeat protein [Candidatus Binatia bacterium]|nr:tetratricopeptide repeat protein [Candidatus Binatia bacterium]